MVVLGIDPGTALTGYGFIDAAANGTLKLIEYGVISTASDMKMEARLLQLYHEMNQKILLHRPEKAAVEKLFFHRNVTTAIAVGQARGVIMLSLAQVGMDILEFTLMEVKQAVVGYGGADKRQVQLMVKAILNLNDIPRPDDAADALAIAICCAHSSRFFDFANGNL